MLDGSRIRRAVIAPGRLQGKGQRAKAEIADYVLICKNTKLAVIEAKQYAKKLAVRFTYATNGRAICGVDMATGDEGDALVTRRPTSCGPRLR